MLRRHGNESLCHFVPHAVQLHLVKALLRMAVGFEAETLWKMCEGNFKNKILKSVSPRLWKGELYRGMLNGLKLKWQPFSQWSGAGSKAWTWFLEQHPPGSGFVCGSGGENKELDCWRPKRRRRWGGRESVSCGLKEDAVCFHPLLSTCCSQKTFHPLSWPEAAFPLRPDRLCDLLQLLECLKLISRTRREIPAAEKQSASLCLLFASVVLFYIYHTRIWSILAEDVLGIFLFPTKE